jgi:signal transduction histidine kinase/FixJ family two-component response regulator
MDEKLLLADDEEGIRTVLGIALADSGYAVLTAENGHEALKIFREAAPSIVLTDIKMPGLDGIELLRLIKAERPETEVIMITGHGDMELAIESLKLEATDFVTKPINDDALAIALKRARERLGLRRQLREYTEDLEQRVERQAARLVEVERLAAVGQAVDGLSAAFRGMAGELEGGIRYFNEMPCFVAVHDPDLKVVTTNQPYRERLGEMVGRRSWEMYPERRGDPSSCPAARTFDTAAGQRSQEVLAGPDGARYPAIVHTAPIRNRKGVLELVLEIAVDVSEVERLREELRRTQDRLATLGLMVGEVSHGVKGILTGLDAGLYLAGSGLRRENLPQVAEGLGVARQMVARLRRVVLDVLYFAKERPLARQRTDVRAFAEGLARLAAAKAEPHGIDFVARLGEGLGEFEIDEAAAAPALLNILENAVDACAGAHPGGGGRIRFRVRGRRDHVRFEVADDGVGMGAETREKIFDLFTSSKGQAGTGLGLFISRNVIEQHGGTIAVDSEPGKGARFRVRWPRGAPATARAPEYPAPA